MRAFCWRISRSSLHHRLLLRLHRQGDLRLQALKRRDQEHDDGDGAGQHRQEGAPWRPRRCISADAAQHSSASTVAIVAGRRW